MEKESKIYIAGHSGMVGSAIMRKLRQKGYLNLVTRELDELDLIDQQAVESFFSAEKPEYVFLAAAKVGGILANNTYRAQFIYENLMIQTNVIHSSCKFGVKKLLFLGSSCIYPRECPQPIKEEYLLTGPLEKTNEPYAIAKIAGIKMCQAYNAQYRTNFISVMPANLYGPNDNFDLNNSHVLPALIRKFVEAKRNDDSHVEVWGTGSPRREFLYVDDLADACLFLMKNYDSSEIINIGCGEDISIKELAEIIKKLVDYEGEIKFNASKPDGAPRKLLDISKLEGMEWRPGVDLETGLVQAIEYFIQKSYIKKN